MVKTIKEFISSCVNSIKCNEIDFNDPESVKLSLAMIMWHVILADGRITEKEIIKLFGFFQKEFALDTTQITTLIVDLKENSNDIKSHVQVIEQQLLNNISAKAILLNHVNALIICDGTADIECQVFEEIRSILMR